MNIRRQRNQSSNNQFQDFCYDSNEDVTKRPSSAAFYHHQSQSHQALHLPQDKQRSINSMGGFYSQQQQWYQNCSIAVEACQAYESSQTTNYENNKRGIAATALKSEQTITTSNRSKGTVVVEQDDDGDQAADSSIMPKTKRIRKEKVDVLDVVEQQHANPKTANREKRRERNRYFARTARERKRHELESLQEQMKTLKAQQEYLKDIVRKRLRPIIGGKILSDLHMHYQHELKPHELDIFASKLKKLQRSFCITDCSQVDNPIVHVSKGFCELTGYPKAEILGQNCRFLQGSTTDAQEVALVSEKLSSNHTVSTVLKNYRRKDTRKGFLNMMQISPMLSSGGKVKFMIGAQTDVDITPEQMCSFTLPPPIYYSSNNSGKEGLQVAIAAISSDNESSGGLSTSTSTSTSASKSAIVGTQQ